MSCPSSTWENDCRGVPLRVRWCDNRCMLFSSDSIHFSLCKCQYGALWTPQHPSPFGNATASELLCIDPLLMLQEKGGKPLNICWERYHMPEHTTWGARHGTILNTHSYLLKLQGTGWMAEGKLIDRQMQPRKKKKSRRLFSVSVHTEEACRQAW